MTTEEHENLVSELGADWYWNSEHTETYCYRTEEPVSDRAKWQEQYAWIVSALKAIDATLMGKIITLNLETYLPSMSEAIAKSEMEEYAENDELHDGLLDDQEQESGEEPAAASKINVVSATKNRSPTVSIKKKSIEQPVLTGTQQLQLEFWTALRGFILDHDTIIRPTKPWAGPWMGFPIGRAGFSLIAVASTQDNESATPYSHQLRVEFVMADDYKKGFFAQLESQKSAIEAEFGGPIVWAETPGKKQSKVFIKKTVNLEDREQWPAYHAWLLQNLEKFHSIFAKRAKQFVKSSPDADLEEP